MIINSLKKLRVRYDESDKTSYSEKVSIRNSKALNFSSRRTCTQKKTFSKDIHLVKQIFRQIRTHRSQAIHELYTTQCIVYTHVCVCVIQLPPEEYADIYLNRDIYLFIYFFNKRPCMMLFILTKLGSEMFQSII